VSRVRTDLKTSCDYRDRCEALTTVKQRRLTAASVYSQHLRLTAPKVRLTLAADEDGRINPHSVGPNRRFSPIHF
jgi:hypothetical protein